MFFKNKKDNTKKGIDIRSIDSSDWITNFWFIDEKLYVTDSKFDDSKSILGYIELNNILDNLKNKANLDRKFITHPNPTESSFLDASITDVETIEYDDNFIFNIVKAKDNYYKSYISKNKKSAYTNLSKEIDKEEIVKKYENLLIIGEIPEGILFTNFEDRKTYIEDSAGKLEEYYINNIKKAISFHKTWVILTENNNILTWDKIGWKLLYAFDYEVNISNFDHNSFLLSDSKEQKTYYLNGEDFENKNPIVSEYFYRLDSIDKKIIVGKPLYIGYNFESYTLPLTFIR